MTDRKAFEAWAAEAGYRSITSNGFDYPLGRALWKAWQAATAAERERCALVINSYPHWLGNQAKAEIAAKIRSGE